MKVGISAVGPTLDDRVDERFGRAANLLVVDTTSLAFEAVDNTANRNALQGSPVSVLRRSSPHVVSTRW